MSRVSVCNLCLNTGAAWYCRKDSIDVLGCPRCGLIYAAETREREDLVGHYGGHYFEPYLKTEAIHLKKRFGKRIEEIKNYAFSGTLLDVGCGAGFFVKLANDSGYAGEGLELSPFAAQYASRQLGLRVFQGKLAEAGFADQSFDIVTLWHIIEHVRDPRTFLGQVNKLLKNNGLLALEIPNILTVYAVKRGANR
ncbi:MAG: class I SAM-dependent methyltransferase [Syntrophobacteraceae bacterium]|jgi:2-polyprenyl-3-methyl-5-hydroxy-6-metoxy-1,4-benzoquinol methylase